MTAEIEALSEICRVLTVEAISVEIDGTPRDDRAARLLDDRVRLLLPLEIPVRDPDGQGGDSPLVRLLKSIPDNTDVTMTKAVIEASRAGEEAVTAAAAAVIDAALGTEVPK